MKRLIGMEAAKVCQEMRRWKTLPTPVGPRRNRCDAHMCMYIFRHSRPGSGPQVQELFIFN